MLINLSSITVPERLRKDYGGPAFEQLKASLSEYGQIQSLLLTPEHVLVAGGRRFAAMTELAWTQAECIIGTPAERDRLLEIELEENVRRLNMSWQERALAVELIHRLKKAADPTAKWGLRETGELLGQDFAHISKLVKVANLLRLTDDKRDNEIWNAPDLNGALTILFKRKEDKIAKQLAEKERTSREETARRLGIGNGNNDDIDKLIRDNTGNVHIVNLSSYYHCDDFRRHLPNMPAHSVDHVVTDIPYGIDMANLARLTDLDTVADQHDVEENIALMPSFLTETYRVLRPGGFCVFWYDLVHHEMLRQLALAAGYRVQNWPLVWCKTHACQNMAASQNFTKATEVAMVCRKENAVLVKQQPVNYVVRSGAEDRARYNNPFAKPISVWQFIYNAVAHSGQVVLDPFAGEGSSALAAIPLGLQPYQIELMPHHHDRAIQHVTQYYREQHKGRVQFV